MNSPSDVHSCVLKLVKMCAAALIKEFFWSPKFLPEGLFLFCDRCYSRFPHKQIQIRFKLGRSDWIHTRQAPPDDLIQFLNVFMLL